MTKTRSIATKKLITSAILVALAVVLTRWVALNALTVKIGFGFVPIVIAAIWYGPAWAGVIYALADLVGALLFPAGAFNPCFTLTAGLTGVVYGLLLYERSPVNAALRRACGGVLRLFHRRGAAPERGVRVAELICIAVIAGLVVGLAFTLLANSLLLHWFYRLSLAALMPTRLIQCAVMIPLHVIMIPLISLKLIPAIERGLR